LNFGFETLEGWQIHEVVGVAQEGLHSIKTKNLKAMIAKVDLSKAFDRVSWLFLHLISFVWASFTLMGLGYGLHQFVTFVVLINGWLLPSSNIKEAFNKDAHSLPCSSS
jgi:hypothetical protein